MRDDKETILDKDKEEEVKPPESPAKKETIERPGRRLTKLEKLACWEEVKAMIENGCRIKDIVHHIQVERGEYGEITPESLKVTLYNWINRHGKELINYRIPTKYLNLLETTIDSVNPDQAINMLFAIQVDRIMIGYSEEKNKRLLDRDITNCLKLANEMVRTMSFLKTDSFKHRAALNSLTGGEGGGNHVDTLEQVQRIKQIYEERYGKAHAEVAFNPESRRKVLNALQKVRAGKYQPLMDLMERNDRKKAELEGREVRGPKDK